MVTHVPYGGSQADMREEEEKSDPCFQHDFLQPEEEKTVEKESTK